MTSNKPHPRKLRMAFDRLDRMLTDIECEMLRRIHQPFARIGNGPPIKVKGKS